MEKGRPGTIGSDRALHVQKNHLAIWPSLMPSRLSTSHKFDAKIPGQGAAHSRYYIKVTNHLEMPGNIL